MFLECIYKKILPKDKTPPLEVFLPTEEKVIYMF
jgi:hypothetical protein